MIDHDREQLREAAYIIGFRANTIQSILTQAHITADLVSDIDRSLQRIDEAMAMARDIISSQPIPLATTTKPQPPHIQEVIT